MAVGAVMNDNDDKLRAELLAIINNLIDRRAVVKPKRRVGRRPTVVDESIPVDDVTRERARAALRRARSG